MARLAAYDNPKECAKKIGFKPNSTPCFLCGKPIRRINDCIFWMGVGGYLYLHADCALRLSIRLLGDWDGISSELIQLHRKVQPEGTEPHPLITQAALVFNLVTNEVRLREEIVKLTPNESKMLYALMKDAGHTINIAKISEEVWGKENRNTGHVRSYIKRLRHKLRDKPPRIILSARGEGYRFVSPT